MYYSLFCKLLAAPKILYKCLNANVWHSSILITEDLHDYFTLYISLERGSIFDSFANNLKILRIYREPFGHRGVQLWVK